MDHQKLRALITVGVCLTASAPLLAQYAGPAILSRGEAPAAMSELQVRFRPFIGIDANYRTGLSTAALSEQGEVPVYSGYGGSVNWGVSGNREWAHTRLGLSYRGDARHYVRHRYYDSIDQSLLLGIGHSLTRHIRLNLNQSAGVFSRNWGPRGLSGAVPFDPSVVLIPETDYFDNRTSYLLSQAQLTVQKTARLSFDLGGTGFAVHRRSTALTGVVGAFAQGDVQYRLSRRTTVGARYDYRHFTSTRSTLVSDIHGTVGTYAVRLSRWLEFTGFGGAYRAESEYIQSLRVDPVIAALLGVTGSSQVVHRIRWMPNFGARLSRTFQSGVAYVHAGRTITAGNGIFQASDQTKAGGGYTYTGSRRWSVDATAWYVTARSFVNVSGQYGYYIGRLEASRRLFADVHWYSGYSARGYHSRDFDRYRRTIHEVSTGLRFTPGEMALRFW